MTNLNWKDSYLIHGWQGSHMTLGEKAFKTEGTVIFKTLKPKVARPIWRTENVAVGDVRDCFGKSGLQEARMKS